MKRFTITQEIHCNEETFWKIFFDKTFTETLFREELGFPEYVIEEQIEKDGVVMERRARGRPRMNMPKPVLKLLGEGFGYVETGRFDPVKRVWSWTTRSNKLADKLRNEGSFRLEPIGDDRVKRIAELIFEAKVFGLGGLIESTTEAQYREGWAAGAAFFNRWIKERA